MSRCICSCHTGLGMGGVDMGCPQCKEFHAPKGLCHCGRPAKHVIDGQPRCGYHQPGFSKATHARKGQAMPRWKGRPPLQPTGFVCSECRAKGAVLLCPHQEHALVNREASAENVALLKKIMGWHPTEYRMTDRHGAVLFLRLTADGLWQGSVRKAATDQCLHCRQQGTEHEHALRHAFDDFDKARFFTESLSDQIVSPY